MGSEAHGLYATRAGLTFGAFGGYKLIRTNGFTLVVQLGAQASELAAAGSVDPDTGEKTSGGAEREVGVLLNLDVGWSF